MVELGTNENHLFILGDLSPDTPFIVMLGVAL